MNPFKFAFTVALLVSPAVSVRTAEIQPTWESMVANYKVPKDGVLYAFVLTPPTGAVTIKTLATDVVLSDEIAKVSPMGSAEMIQWTHASTGLILHPPKSWPGKIVSGFKGELKRRPFKRRLE